MERAERVSRGLELVDKRCKMEKREGKWRWGVLGVVVEGRSVGGGSAAVVVVVCLC